MAPTRWLRSELDLQPKTRVLKQLGRVARIASSPPAAAAPHIPPGLHTLGMLTRTTQYPITPPGLSQQKLNAIFAAQSRSNFQDLPRYFILLNVRPGFPKIPAVGQENDVFLEIELNPHRCPVHKVLSPLHSYRHLSRTRVGILRLPFRPNF
jgi:hypothetical protein